LKTELARKAKIKGLKEENIQLKKDKKALQKNVMNIGKILRKMKDDLSAFDKLKEDC